MFWLVFCYFLCEWKLNVLLCFIDQPQSFTDLAEMVAKVRGPVQRLDLDSESEEEDEGEEGNGYSSEPCGIYGNEDVEFPDTDLRQRHGRSSLTLSEGGFT